MHFRVCSQSHPAPTWNRSGRESRRGYPWDYVLAIASHIEDVYGESSSTVVEKSVQPTVEQHELGLENGWRAENSPGRFMATLDGHRSLRSNWVRRLPLFLNVISICYFSQHVLTGCLAGQNTNCSNIPLD
jgi:hypothetical protein